MQLEDSIVKSVTKAFEQSFTASAQKQSRRRLFELDRVALELIDDLQARSLRGSKKIFIRITK